MGGEGGEGGGVREGGGRSCFCWNIFVRFSI